MGTAHLVSSASAWLLQRACPAPPSSELAPRLLPPSSPRTRNRGPETTRLSSLQFPEPNTASTSHSPVLYLPKEPQAAAIAHATGQPRALPARPCGHRLDLPAGHPCRLAATVTCPACGSGSVSSLLPRGGVSVEDEGGEDSGVRLWLGIAPGPRGGGGGGRWWSPHGSAGGMGGQHGTGSRLGALPAVEWEIQQIDTIRLYAGYICRLTGCYSSALIIEGES
ncbi:uncharacterized protein [Miscanthus floridulus]|uniref:uncharacterized protein n=1 Tax=Miscanthus floridulus TaxID=154761 RepID=UPI0034580722